MEVAAAASSGHALVVLAGCASQDATTLATTQSALNSEQKRMMSRFGFSSL